METKNKHIKYGDKQYNCTIKTYGPEDDKILHKLYSAWKYYASVCEDFGARRPAIAEGLSETVFCRVTGSVRIVKAPQGLKTSFDVFDLKRGLKQELKATSIKKDLTSFSPITRFDEIYWMDFYRDGAFDGKFDIYKLAADDILNVRLNKEQLFCDQQLEGRRPRFSVREKIIIPKRLTPIYKGSLGLNKKTPKVTATRLKKGLLSRKDRLISELKGNAYNDFV